MIQIIIPDKGQAHILMTHLCSVLDDYGFFTVGDLAELIDAPIPGDQKLGWTDVREIEIFIGKGQPIIRFPDPVKVDHAQTPPVVEDERGDPRT